MVRYLFLALCATAACAGPQVEKMPWPIIPPPDPIEPIDASAASQGGPLIAEPVETTIVVQHEAGPELPPESRHDGRRYLLLRWPLPATGINSLYGKRRDPVNGSTRTHNGVDLEADYGAIVNCAAAGLVIYAGWNHGHGRMVVVEHAGGYVTSYSHLAQILAQPNSTIDVGRPVGMVGNSGRSTGPHLHFEVSRHGQRIDPLDVLGVSLALD